MAPKDEYPDQPEHPPRFSVSRRDFLKTAGLSSLAAGVVGGAGLGTGASLLPVRQAFGDVDALMCGFCTPGFVMAAVALLEKHPSPTVDEARRGLDGNICRCGTFTRIMEATMRTKGVTRA